MARVIAEVGANGYICRMDCSLHADADLRCERIAREWPERYKSSIRSLEDFPREKLRKEIVNSKQLVL